MAIVAGAHDTRPDLECLDAGLWKEYSTATDIDGWPICTLPTVVLAADSVGTPSSEAARESGG